MDQNVNVYNNFIPVFNKQFVSPASDNGDFIIITGLQIHSRSAATVFITWYLYPAAKAPILLKVIAGCMQAHLPFKK